MTRSIHRQRKRASEKKQPGIKTRRALLNEHKTAVRYLGAGDHLSGAWYELEEKDAIVSLIVGMLIAENDLDAPAVHVQAVDYAEGRVLLTKKIAGNVLRWLVNAVVDAEHPREANLSATGVKIKGYEAIPDDRDWPCDAIAWED